MNDQCANASTAVGMTESRDARREARGQFVRIVAKAVDKLVEVHGCSRERATALVLREIAETVPSSDDELTYVKQHYKLSHIQATRALTVSTAVKNLVQNEKISQCEAVKRLTSKLASASFSNVVANINTARDDDSNSQATTSRKASEISIPQIPIHHQQPGKPPAKTPVKKVRSSGKSSALKAVKSTRKRSIDEIGANNTQLNNTQLIAEPQTITEPRARSDSVIEAVTAKLKNQEEAVTAKLKNQEPNMNAENVKPPPRNKRSRGGGSSLDDSEPGSNAKRARPSTA